MNCEKEHIIVGEVSLKLFDGVWQHKLTLMPYQMLQIGPRSGRVDVDWDLRQLSKWIPESISRYLKRTTQFDILRISDSTPMSQKRAGGDRQ
jgi:hypothetical protein